MSLKKILIRNKKAQATVEYITILLAILGLFIAFLNRVEVTLDRYHNEMVTRIATQQ